MANPKERKIPVFSVWKNDAILKNIFLINTLPPSLDQIEVQEGPNCETQKEFEETLVIGRHPDCDIRLEHPSVSRFHLRVHSMPSSTHLSITDLSSVHGTWVSEKIIEPNVRTSLEEGDTLRIGGSSRVYRLHWIPFSQAYDMEHPFVPPLDFSETQEDDDEEESFENENSSGSEDVSAHFVTSVLKSLEARVMYEEDELVAEKLVGEEPLLKEENTQDASESSFGDENSDVSEQNEISLADEMQNENYEVSVDQNSGSASLFLDEENTEDASEYSFGNENSDVCDQNEMPLEMQIENSEVYVDQNSGSASLLLDEIFERSVLKEVQMQNDSLSVLENAGCLEILCRGENSAQLEKENFNICMNKNSSSESSFHHKKSAVQNENSEIPASDNFCLESLFKDENSEVCVLKEIPQNHQMQDEHFNILVNDNRQVVDVASDGLVPLFMGENWEWIGQKNHTKEYNQLPITNEDESFVNSVLHGLDYPFLVKTSELAPKLENSLACGSEVSTEMTVENEKRDEEDGSWNFWYGSHIVPSSPTKDGFPETDNHNLHKEDQCTQCESESKDRKLWSFWSGNMGVESLCSSLSDAEAFFSDRENVYQSPELRSSSKKHLRSPLLTSARNSGCSIWSRRGKQESSPQVLMSSRTKGKNTKNNQENVKDEDPISRALFRDDQEEEEEIFTPDKENFTPNTHKSMRKLAVLKEATRSNSGKLCLSKITVSPPDISPASNKENFSPKVFSEKKTVRRSTINKVRPLPPLLTERKSKRVPFQTLISESLQKSVSETCISDTTVRINCPKPTTKEKTRKWNMVVDTTTLLNKASRQALKLLAGLKGMQLIIPRIVIGELESLKRQTSFLRRNSQVLSALDWIQDRVSENPWWVHLQNSIEEGLPVASTPPALPLADVSCGTPFGSRAELLTPTPDDHVLEYALCFRKARNDGQLILLSNDITLKIKAMAEGIICEEAEEFRESLVSPFSERFLWADSSPRGQTWRCADDIVLKEKFYPRSLKMMPNAIGKNVKGLKLILLHNSQYFERMSTGCLLH